MIIKTTKFVILLLFLSVVISLTASDKAHAQNFFQNDYKDRFFSAAVGTGQNGYFGELNYKNNIRRGFRNAVASFEARLLDKLSARAEFTYFTISGADKFAPDSTFERQRNLSFQSRSFELNLSTMLYFFSYPKSYKHRNKWEPFLSLGVGVTRFNPTTVLEGESYVLRDIMTEGVAYDRYTLVFPVGLGVKARITDYLGVILEAGYRFTLTDYLDDVSADYADFPDNTIQQRLSNRKDEIAVINRNAFDRLVPGMPRGDSENNDAYLMINFKIEYFLPIFITGK